MTIFTSATSLPTSSVDHSGGVWQRLFSQSYWDDQARGVGIFRLDANGMGSQADSHN
jgi:hypothetical protein